MKVGVPGFREDKWKNRDKTGKCSISQDFEEAFLLFVPEWLELPQFYHSDPTCPL